MHTSFFGLLLLGAFYSVVTATIQLDHTNLSINGSININQLRSHPSGTLKRSSENPIVDAVLNIHQHLNVSNAQKILNNSPPDYEVSLYDIQGIKSPSSPNSKARLISNILFTYSVSSGSIAVMSAFCANQKKHNKMFADGKICTVFASSVVIGITSNLSYMTYLDIGILETLILPMKWLFKSLLLNGGANTDKLVYNIPQYHWQNYSSVLNEFSKTGITINDVSYEYGILGIDNLPYFYNPSFNITLGQSTTNI